MSNINDSRKLFEDEKGKEMIYNILEGMHNFILEDKPHIKEYKKIRNMYEEIIDNMYNYYDEGKFKPKTNKKLKLSPEEIRTMNVELDMNTYEGQQGAINFLVFKNLEQATCITEEYLEKNRFRKPEKIEMLKSMLNSKASLFEIRKTDVEMGQVILKDIFSGKEHLITDIGLSRNMHNENIYLYTRVISYNNISFGTGLNLIFKKNDKFIKKWIEENKKNYNNKKEIMRFFELYNELQRDDRGIKFKVNEV